MMMNLSQVSEGVLSELDARCLGPVAHHGQVRAVYHQADKRNRLMTISEPLRVVGIEGKSGVQLAWLVESMAPSPKTYGLGGRDTYTATALLLVMARSQRVLGSVLGALRAPHGVEVERVEMDTLRVLRENWLIDVGGDKNYDPALLAWALRCRVVRVELTDDCQ